MDDFIPMEAFWKDHWSTFAYIETCLVDQGGFRVCFDPRMRQCLRHWRTLPVFKGFHVPDGFEIRGTASHEIRNTGVPMGRNEGSRLKGGKTIQGHDDWHCVQDLVEVGLLSGGVEPGEMLDLTDLGRTMINQIRSFKAGGGSFGAFDPQAAASQSSTEVDE